jgi:periplasmic protein TonB
MPANMFQELVSPHADSTRRWYTLPLSFFVHTLLLAVLIVVPLVATDVLPRPRFALEYMIAGVPPALPPAPSAPRQVRAQPSNSANSHAAPLVVPAGIRAESAIEMSAEPVDDQGITGLVDGFGAGVALVESPPVPAAPRAPLPVGGVIKPPIRVKDVAPVYPEIARRARIEGIVIIRATIGNDGKVQKAELLRSEPLLDQAALDAVRGWEYTPTLLNGQPVAVTMTVTVQFKLE